MVEVPVARCRLSMRVLRLRVLIFLAVMLTICVLSLRIKSGGTEDPVIFKA